MAYKQSPGRMNMPKTGRGIDSVALMTGETSPLLKFPIKKGTKLSENERVAVNIMGQETVFSDLAKAKSTLAAHRKTNPTADVKERGSITGYTATGKDESGKEVYTEERNPAAADAKSGSKRNRTEQAKLSSRSKANPEGKDQRSARLQKDKKGIESTFTISEDESGTSQRKYKS
jgi:hypothetical protein